MQILENASLSSYNSFRISVRARSLWVLEKDEDILEFFHNKEENKPWIVLGGGTNSLFTKDFLGTVIHIHNQGIHHQFLETYTKVFAAAGVNWNDLVKYTLDHGIGGLENLSLIPGTVGAAPVQNIGAYGMELQDYFYELKAFDLESGEFRTFNKKECEFSYRNSVFKSRFKDRFIILGVWFHFPLESSLKLDYGSIREELAKEGIQNPSIYDLSRIVSRIRLEKLPDPQEIGNAGSFFKNPIIEIGDFHKIKEEHPNIIYYPNEGNKIKLAAGWLIEQCGWKGKSLGNVGTWKNQALVLVNLGNAKGDEVLNLAHTIQNSVYEKFKVQLEPEVNIY